MAAAQFVLAGTLLLGMLAMTMLHKSDGEDTARCQAWLGQLLLLLHGLAGVAGLGILVTIPLLRTGTRSALAAEFEITLQIQLLERAMYPVVDSQGRLVLGLFSHSVASRR